MTNSLADLLANRDFDEPSEIKAIKEYVRETFESDVEIQLRDKEIVITSTSASLANSLRLKTTELKKRAQTTKKLIFRIR